MGLCRVLLLDHESELVRASFWEKLAAIPCTCCEWRTSGSGSAKAAASTVNTLIARYQNEGLMFSCQMEPAAAMVWEKKKNTTTNKTLFGQKINLSDRE